MLNEAIKPCSTVDENPSAIAGRWVMHRIDDCFIGTLHRDIALLVHNTIDESGCQSCNVWIRVHLIVDNHLKTRFHIIIRLATTVLPPFALVANSICKSDNTDIHTEPHLYRPA